MSKDFYLVWDVQRKVGHPYDGRRGAIEAAKDMSSSDGGDYYILSRISAVYTEVVIKSFPEEV